MECKSLTIDVDVGMSVEDPMEIDNDVDTNAKRPSP
jgi:hypothetical protein